MDLFLLAVDFSTERNDLESTFAAAIDSFSARFEPNGLD